MKNTFDNPLDAIRILREMKIIRMIKHCDVVTITHVILPVDRETFNTVEIVLEEMDTDLHRVYKFDDKLTMSHHTVILYQILRGLQYVHACGVLHRDMKPSNILISSNCKIKIADFGLARPKSDGKTQIKWSDYVATRWYRAPEVCGCSYGHYTTAIDMWGVGCIYAELLLRRPMFPGKNVVNQLECIIRVLGKPDGEAIAKVKNAKARNFLLHLPDHAPIPFETIFPTTSAVELDILKKLLTFDPDHRLTAEQALAHPLFELLPKTTVDVSPDLISKISQECTYDEKTLTTESVREMVYQEALLYNSSFS